MMAQWNYITSSNRGRMWFSITQIWWRSNGILQSTLSGSPTFTVTGVSLEIAQEIPRGPQEIAEFNQAARDFVITRYLTAQLYNVPTNTFTAGSYFDIDLSQFSGKYAYALLYLRDDNYTTVSNGLLTSCYELPPSATLDILSPTN